MKVAFLFISINFGILWKFECQGYGIYGNAKDNPFKKNTGVKQSFNFLHFYSNDFFCYKNPSTGLPTEFLLSLPVPCIRCNRQ